MHDHQHQHHQVIQGLEQHPQLRPLEAREHKQTLLSPRVIDLQHILQLPPQHILIVVLLLKRDLPVGHKVEQEPYVGKSHQDPKTRHPLPDPEDVPVGVVLAETLVEGVGFGGGHGAGAKGDDVDQHGEVEQLDDVEDPLFEEGAGVLELLAAAGDQAEEEEEGEHEEGEGDPGSEVDQVGDFLSDEAVVAVFQEVDVAGAKEEHAFFSVDSGPLLDKGHVEKSKQLKCLEKYHELLLPEETHIEVPKTVLLLVKSIP